MDLKKYDTDKFGKRTNWTSRGVVVIVSDQIREDCGVFARVRASMARRAQACIMNQEQHLQHLL
jgi:molybdenum cofactor biosynthesis enzyme MoaA